MKNLILILFLVFFGLIIVFGMLGLVGTLLGITFGAIGAVIGLAFKIVFSPLIFVILGAFAIYWIFGRRRVK